MLVGLVFLSEIYYMLLCRKVTFKKNNTNLHKIGLKGGKKWQGNALRTS